VTKNIKQLFDEYMYECEFVQGLKPQTLHGYRQNFTTLIKLIPDLSLETLTPGNMLRFFKILQERDRIVGKGRIMNGVTKSTVATYWSKHNSFFEWLKIKGKIIQNPLSVMKRPTARYENKKFLKREEIEKILTAILTHSDSTFLLKRNLVIFYILLFCGLRKGELLQLQIKDIDFENKILTVRGETSKVSKTRYVPLHSLLIRHLIDYIKERKGYKTAYLIVSKNIDHGLSTEGLKQVVMKLTSASGVKFHVHQFRHTFAVNFLKSSSNIAKLQQLLGHGDPSMTLQYVRCLPPHEMRQDIEIMSIDNFV